MVYMSKLSPEEKAAQTLRLARTGEYLKNIRKELSLSLVDAGEGIGITSMFLSEIERGNKMPSDATVRSIANFYKVKEEDLFAMLGKVPLGAVEELKEFPTLTNALAKIARSGMSDAKKEALYERLRTLVMREVEEDD
jgi:transcriptional regulator with XRE-family HTH domain